MQISELFWSASFDEMKRGFAEKEDSFVCLLCGKEIEKGIIYSVDSVLYEAEKYMKKHIEDKHGSVFEYLNSQDKKLTGLSEHQSRLMALFFEGRSDDEVQKELNIGSASTIRNHRFLLREKEKQAKVFLVLMELVREKNQKAPKTIMPHKTATMVDDRYKITEEEYEKAVKKYFPDGVQGRLSAFSMQEKYKIVVLREIIKRFDRDRTYSEKQVNEILKNVYEYDYATIRRYLIEYGFMDRKDDGSEYWVKGNNSSENKGPKEAEKVISGVYQIRNIRNGKIFVTGGRNISKLNGVKFELNFGSYRNKLLQQEWKEYGEDAFAFEMLETFEEEGDPKEVSRKIKNLEKEWIAKLQPFGDRGYNKA